MKILALTPINQNKTKLNSAKQNLFISKPLSHDTISFHGGKKKAVEKAGAEMFDGFLDNIGGELGKKVKKLLSDNDSRPVFMTMLVSLAATATELILKSGEKPEPIEIEQEKPKPVADGSASKEAVQETAAKKTGRKSIVDRMGKEAFIAKLQDMVNKDYTLAQMSTELDNISIVTVKKYIKEFGIKPQNNTVKEQGTKPARKTREEKLADFINSKDYRSEYLTKLEPYPEILAQYKKAMENIVDEPKNEFYSDALSGMEKAFKILFALKPKHNKPYLEKFNDKYSNNSYYSKVFIPFTP